MAFGSFTLTGTFQALDGTPAVGRVQVDGIPQVIIDTAGDKFRIGPRTVVLGSQGDFSISLPSDSTTGSSTGIGYRVTVSLKHQNVAPVEFYAPAIGVSIDLADVTPQQVIALTPLGVSKAEFDAYKASAPSASAFAISSVASTATASATLTANRHAPVDATSGARTMTLPTTAAVGALLSVEKTDASTNPVNVTGTMRGTASSTIALTSQYDARTFLSEGSGSWRPVSDHRTKTSLDAAYARKGPVIDVRDYGTTVTATSINAALVAAAAAGSYGKIVLPAGKILLDAKIVLQQGVLLEGGGGHDTASRPGTEFQPAAGYTGVGFHYPAAGGNLWHHAGLRRMRVRGFTSHGVHIEGGMGELSVLDEVMAQSNGGDGIRIEGASTPAMLGRIAVHSNTGAGVRFVSQTEGHTHVLYLAGDNNGESLMTIDNADTATAFTITAWKAERWGASPGNPNVFVINNGNGCFVNLNTGRVHIGLGVTAGNSIIRQTGSPARIKARISNANGGGADYAFGYQDVLNSTTYTVAQVQRLTLWSSEVMSVISPGATAFKLIETLNGQAIYVSSATPVASLAAPPGSVCLRNSGQVYFKESATDSSGWAVVPTQNGTVLPTKIGASGGSVGFYGTTPIAKPTGTPSAATDLATALTLVNDLRTKLLALGIVA